MTNEEAKLTPWFIAVNEAMQPMEEMEGPETPEYIDIMRAIRNEADARLRTALERMQEDSAVVQFWKRHGPWQIEDTGGGCQALFLRETDKDPGFYVCLTDDEGPQLPEDMAHGVTIGFYEKAAAGRLTNSGMRRIVGPGLSCCWLACSFVNCRSTLPMTNTQKFAGATHLTQPTLAVRAPAMISVTLT